MRADFGVQATEFVPAAHAEMVRDGPRHTAAEFVAGCRQLVGRAVLAEHQMVVAPRGIVQGECTRFLCPGDAVYEAGIHVAVSACVDAAEIVFPLPAAISRCPCEADQQRVSVGPRQIKAAGNLDVAHLLSIGGGVGLAVTTAEVLDLQVGEVLGVTQRLALVAARDCHDLGRFHGGSDVDTVDDVVVAVSEIASRRGGEMDGSRQIPADVADVDNHALLRVSDEREENEC